MFSTGDIVQIQDRDRDVANYSYASVVRPATKGEEFYTASTDPGFVVRYENGCEVWVREYDVLETRLNAPIEDLREEYGQNELDQDRLPTGDGFLEWLRNRR